MKIFINATVVIFTENLWVLGLSGIMSCQKLNKCIFAYKLIFS